MCVCWNWSSWALPEPVCREGLLCKGRLCSSISTLKVSSAGQNCHYTVPLLYILAECPSKQNKMLIFWHLLHVEPRNGLNQSSFHRAKVKSLKKKKSSCINKSEKGIPRQSLSLLRVREIGGGGGLKYLNWTGAFSVLPLTVMYCSKAMSVTLSGYAFVLPNVLARSACVQKKKKKNCCALVWAFIVYSCLCSFVLTWSCCLLIQGYSSSALWICLFWAVIDSLLHIALLF